MNKKHQSQEITQVQTKVSLATSPNEDATLTLLTLEERNVSSQQAREKKG